jgi:hypothetical protein
MAYFTADASSNANTFQTGTMSINVDQTNIQNTQVTTSLQPGDPQQVRFDLVNTGSLPVYLRAFATGSWNADGLDPNLVKVTDVEYYDGTTWQLIKHSNAGITGDVYYSPNGSSSGLIQVNSGQRVPFRLTVVLDTSAGNDYLNKMFSAQVHAEARQITNGATWPTP